MTDRPQDSRRAQDPQADVRNYWAPRMKQAWRGLGISALLLVIASLTYFGLRSDGVPESQRDIFLVLLWLFVGRFVWSTWKYFRARREATRFRNGIERQLKVNGTYRD